MLWYGPSKGHGYLRMQPTETVGCLTQLTLSDIIAPVVVVFNVINSAIMHNFDTLSNVSRTALHLNQLNEDL